METEVFSILPELNVDNEKGERVNGSDNFRLFVELVFMRTL